MRYLVLKNSYGFKNRFWNRGETVDIDESENPSPDLFRPLGKPKNLSVHKDESKIPIRTKLASVAPKKTGRPKFYPS